MGVCIETWSRPTWTRRCASHTLYGCVYWNFFSVELLKLASRHTLYGCVYWNDSSRKTLQKFFRVTPYMGVCIETNVIYLNNKTPVSHPIWVCVLKRGGKCVDRMAQRHTLYGCVYWNISASTFGSTPRCHTLYGCVYWNLTNVIKPILEDYVTPYMGVCIETK